MNDTQIASEVTLPEHPPKIKKVREYHGLSNAPEYMTWARMRNRCYNPKNQDFHDYGGNGVVVSDDWKNFSSFYRDMGPMPTPKHTIDRINGGTSPYCKENCRWATQTQQARNRCSNRKLTFNGRTLLVIEWAEELGCSERIILSRLNYGWTVAETLSTPVVRRLNRDKQITFNGETFTPNDWDRKMGFPLKTVWLRIENGWSVESAVTKPVTRSLKFVSFNGETMTIAEWARKLDVSAQAMSARLRAGWSVERTLTEPFFKMKPRIQTIANSAATA